MSPNSKWIFYLVALKVLVFVSGSAVPQLDSDSGNDDETSGLAPLKILKQGGTPDPVTGTNIQTGIGCGFYTLVPGQTVQITSSNYGITTYDNNDACVWRFTGDNCLLAAKCPCFDVPASFQCIGDYLKISDSVLYSQKFCGEVAPQGAYRSVSGHLRVRFRSDYAGLAGRGFLCYVFCTEPGLADPALSLVTNPASCFGGGVSSTTPLTGEIPIAPPFSPLPANCNPPIDPGFVGNVPIGENGAGCP